MTPLYEFDNKPQIVLDSLGGVMYYMDMENNKMYLTAAEAKAKNLPSAQEQIDRYNRAIEEARKSPKVEDLGGCFERNIARVILES